jgi:DNA-binding transcriptional ArsR family regulator
MTKMPWRYRVQKGDLGHVTAKRREVIAELRGQGERVGRIAEAVGIDERKVRYHLRRLRDAGDPRCMAMPAGRPRAAHV